MLVNPKAVFVLVACALWSWRSAGWLLAARHGRDAPIESRIVEVAAAFVEAGGHTGSAGAGRALASLWAANGGSGHDPEVVRALESLLADRVGEAATAE